MNTACAIGAVLATALIALKDPKIEPLWISNYEANCGKWKAGFKEKTLIGAGYSTICFLCYYGVIL